MGHMASKVTSVYNWRSEFQRLEGAYAPSTMRSYRADVEAFEAWCASEGLEPFPAEVRTLCRFLEDQGTQKAPSTVRRRLCAIRKVHRLLGLPDPTRGRGGQSLDPPRPSRQVRPAGSGEGHDPQLSRQVPRHPADTPWGLRKPRHAVSWIRAPDAAIGTRGVARRGSRGSGRRVPAGPDPS